MPWTAWVPRCWKPYFRWSASDMDGPSARPPSRWHRYIEAAVREPLAVNPPAANRAAVLARSTHGDIKDAWEQIRLRVFPKDHAAVRAQEPRRRMDLRLVPPALLVWAAAIAGMWLQPAGLVILCIVLLLITALLFGLVLRRRSSGRFDTRSFLMTIAAALLLAVIAAAHSAVASSQRYEGPVAQAIASRSAVVAEVEITGPPRELRMAGHSQPGGRWAAPAGVKSMIVGGQVLTAKAELLILGGADWGGVVPGQRIRTTGNLNPPAGGQTEAGSLSASSPPVVLASALPWQQGPGELRGKYMAAADWLEGDARGLLPGMVTGDTSALNQELNAAMKTVGMTHLTAVSGANCSIVLGALLLAARCLRLPRVAAAGIALVGLWLFVLMVGPDASVLRAALMGAIALASLAGGRTGRGLSFLCLAVIGLLLLDPGLGMSFGFLLSVLATLGIIVLGRQIIDWIPAIVPRWAAAGLAVPLSAQLLCSPAIVILQPQFSTYSLLANIVAAPLVAPVTILGTAAVPLVPAVPWMATLLIACAGVFANGVAAIARFTAALPGAALPWPEGAFGVATMVMFSSVNVLALWLAVRPLRTVGLAMAGHVWLSALLEGFHNCRNTPMAAVSTPFSGLVQQRRRGTLIVRNPHSGRNQEWPLPRPNEPGLRRRTPSAGGM